MKTARTFTLLLVSLLGLVHLDAAYTLTNAGQTTTVTATSNAGSCALSLSRNPSTGVVTWSVTKTLTGGSGGPSAFITYTTGLGAAAGATIVDPVPGSMNTTSTGTFSPAVGSWIRFVARCQSLGAVDTFDTAGYFLVGTTGEATNKVTVSLPINKSDKAKTYKLIQGGVEVGAVTLEPGQGLIQTFTVPAGTAVTVVELVEDMALDGPVWVESSGTVTQVTVGTVTPTSVPSGGSDPSPTSVTPDNVQPENTVTTNTEKQVWEPTVNVTSGTSDFTVKAYREGVDKIVAAINGETTATNPTLPAPSATWQPSSTVVTGAIAKLPASPIVTGPAPLTAISVTIDLKKIDGTTLYSKNINTDFAAAPFAGPVSIFRGIMLAVMTGIFFFLAFQTVRGAFTGK